MKTIKMWAIFVIIAFALSCAPQVQAPLDSDKFLPPEIPKPTKSQPSLAEQASIWSDSSPSGWLFSDRKASRVNDVVTIKVIESATAEGKAATKLSKKNEVEAGITGLVGLEDILARYNPTMELGTMLGANTDSNFTGSGETERSGRLIATITAVVTDVLSNGNLVIEGRKEIRVNDETQILIITGIVRPDDISADNSVLSSRIAQTRLSFEGKGVTSHRQRPGWLSRFLDAVWPF